jgi:hypothetical protein
MKRNKIAVAKKPESPCSLLLRINPESPDTLRI